MTTALVLTQEIILKCDDEKSSECKMIGSTVTGTATRIKWKDNYFWLTAAHVCSTGSFTGQVALGRVISFKVGGSNAEEVSKSITFNIKKDLCIVPANPGPHRVISSKTPDLGEKASIVAYPGGAFDARMYPIYDGRYAGQFDEMCVITIPVSGGSSGSSVLNSKMQVIGVVSAVMKSFNHFTIVTCLDDIRSFLSLAAEQSKDFESRETQITSQTSDPGLLNQSIQE
jgi:hypothetical protein